ncbi:MAG: putative DNA modification methylase [Prokaryotic dsDNA virus sp.]|nr:MAG: putative DNA modification methylase [Prokaryotic dsDNA virus sp.]|tara:strand:- start:31305 stop:32633 length:1329 start_codon:yes stop_codon:yes gene_type:complete
MNNITVTANLSEIFNNYEAQKEYALECLDKFNQATEELKSNSLFMGAYAEGLRDIPTLKTEEDEVLKRLNKSAWRFTYEKLNIEHIAPNTHLKEFKNFLENPAEFNIDNVRSIFKDYVQDPRQMALQAFAEVFNTLDPFYKSHDNFRVGVKGLPKRVIVYTSDYYGWDKVLDIINVIARFQNQFDLCKCEYSLKAYVRGEEASEYRLEMYEKLDNTTKGLTFKYHKNGNVHIIFDKERLQLINDCLAEYYGQVLPDSYEHTEKPVQSKEVSKDLQFYKTPEKAVKYLLDDIYFKDGDLILEPSCGDGAILDGIRNNINKDRYQKINYDLYGVEFDYNRFKQCQEKGYKVYNDNFLTFKTNLKFDKIIMNPPFYGKHYFKHIEKAFELLSDNGSIYAILPITAIDHGLLNKYKHSVTHMPIGSFRESGTNINTIIVRIEKSIN